MSVLSKRFIFKSFILSDNQRLYVIFLLLAIVMMGCSGCGGTKPSSSESNRKTHEVKVDSLNSTIFQNSGDTTSQEWQNKHYFIGTKIPLPDSLKNYPGLGKGWFSLPANIYKPIVFDKLSDPNLEEVKVYFNDSVSKSTIKTLIVWKENPYIDLPFKRVSNERLLKIEGIIRYDLSTVSKETLRPLLMSMDVNIDTVTTKIIAAEVMTGQDSPLERTALANSYVLNILDNNNNIVASQTTYKIYDQNGIKINELIENGNGLYQFSITKDGNHLGAIFGGRYGCNAQQHLKPYLLIYNTKTKNVIHREEIEFSENIFANFNYIVVTTGGDPVIGYNKKIYKIDDSKIYIATLPLLRTNDWFKDGVVIKGQKIFFTSNYFIKNPFTSTKN